MKFEEVLPALRAGKKVRRKSWKEHLIFRFNLGCLVTLTNIDLVADDWEVVKEKVKKTMWVVVCYNGISGYAYLKDGGTYVLKETAEQIGRRTAEFHSAQEITVEVEE
jgi:hypothetical protein